MVAGTTLETRAGAGMHGSRGASRKERSWAGHLTEFRYASRSAIAGTSICFSSPSGMNDRPVLRSSSMSMRRTVSLVPSAPADREAVGRLRGDHAR